MFFLSTVMKKILLLTFSFLFFFFVLREKRSRFSLLPASNLDHLVHLKWLDLSFNNIKAIEGLEKLTELMDLSLYNNQVIARRPNIATEGEGGEGVHGVQVFVTRRRSTTACWLLATRIPGGA